MSYSMDIASCYGSVNPTNLLGTQDGSFIVRLYFDAVSSVEVNQRSVRLAGCRECLLGRNMGGVCGLFEGSLPVFAGETEDNH
jgi:hypothetical protein